MATPTGEDRLQTFEAFWPYYLREHANPTNRLLHVAGTTGAAVTLAAALLTRRPKLLMLAPLIGYGPAWVGHFRIENNRPATFTYPVWSLMGDIRMNALFWSGRLDEELERLGIGKEDASESSAA